MSLISKSETISHFGVVKQPGKNPITLYGAYWDVQLGILVQFYTFSFFHQTLTSLLFL